MGETHQKVIRVLPPAEPGATPTKPDMTVKPFDEPARRVSSDAVCWGLASRLWSKKKAKAQAFGDLTNRQAGIGIGTRLQMTTRGRLAARLGFWNLGQHPSRAFLDGHKSVPFDWLTTRGLSRRGSRLPGSNDEQRWKHQVVGGPLLVSLRITATLESN